MANRMLIISKGSSVVEGNVHELLNAAVFQLRLEVSEPGKAMEILRTGSAASELQLEPEGSIKLKANRLDVPAIIKELVEKGILVYSVVPVNSLEQYFLDKT